MKKITASLTYIFFFLTIFIVVCLSCKKDSNDEENNIPNIPSSEKCYVLRLTSGAIDFKFTYNDQYQLVKITAFESGYTDYSEIQHDASGNIIRIEYYDGSYNMYACQDFEYQDGKVIKGYENSNNEYDLIYIYDANGLLKSIDIIPIALKGNIIPKNKFSNVLIGYLFSEVYNDKGLVLKGDRSSQGKILFEWNDNNLSKESWESSQGSLLMRYQYTSYDNYRNAFKEINYPVRIVGGPYSITISANNFTHFTYTDYNGDSETTNMQYNYNELGYPLTMSFVGDETYMLEYLCTNCTPFPTIADAGPDQIDLPNPSTTLAGNTPEFGTGSWSIINGTGGTIQDIHDPNTLFISSKDSALFVLRWEVSNECGTTTDDVIISFKPLSGVPCPGLPEFSYEGQTYQTVQINNQCWMKENLNVGQMISGSNDQTDNNIKEKYCYNNDILNCDKFGGLYQWNELMGYDTIAGMQGICPPGWHIPSYNEWFELINYYGGEFIAGGKLKESGTLNWNYPNTGATNESGFTVLPGGIRKDDLSFIYIGKYGGFWSSSQYDFNDAYRFYFGYDYEGVYYSNNNKYNGRSVRCLKD